MLPAPIPSPVAGCGAALSGAGLGGVLATSAYVRIGSPPPCGSSSTGTCGASGVLSSWGVVDGASSEERVPSPEGGTSTSNPLAQTLSTQLLGVDTALSTHHSPF